MAKIVVSEFLTLDGVYQGFDSYRLMVYPVILGTGKKLFRDGAEANLKLVDSYATNGGVLILTFEPR